MSVLLNTEATTVTIQRGKKLGYALPLNTDFQSVENLKKFDVTKCPLHANQECIMKSVNELKSSRKLFSMKSETDDGLSSCSNFPERPTEAELAANKPVLYPMQRLMRNKGKKFTWTDEAQVSFENIKRELCEAPVLGMPTEKGMFVLDTDASVVAILGILHQEQEWNGRMVLCPKS